MVPYLQTVVAELDRSLQALSPRQQFSVIFFQGTSALEMAPSGTLAPASAEQRLRVEELFTVASRHKQEIDFTLRHWATPVERVRIEDRLGSLMRIAMRLRELRTDAESPEPLPAA